MRWRYGRKVSPRPWCAFLALSHNKHSWIGYAQKVVIFLARGAEGKGLGDPEINALLIEARDKVAPYARHTWLDHSPHLVVGIEDMLRDMKNMEMDMAQAQEASDPLPTQSQASHSAVPTQSPAFSSVNIVRVYQSAQYVH